MQQKQQNTRKNKTGKEQSIKLINITLQDTPEFKNNQLVDKEGIQHQ